jgi:hypothetical protein
MRSAIVVLFAVLLAAVGFQATAAGSGSEGENADVLEFDTMAGVVEPFTGAAHPVRGVNGGGLPWELDRARGTLDADGRLDVRVEGLVLARRAPVPPALQGTNPIPQFRAVVSCLTPASPDTGERVTTAPFPASADGDAHIRATVDLPEPCIAPIVFVTSPTEAWFASTGR